MHPPNFKPSPGELRLFALLLLIPAAILHFGFQLTTPALALAACACLGLITPTLAKPVHNLLVLLTWPIGYFLNHLLLASIYYLLVTPIALVFKLRGKVPLKLHYPPQTSSNFTPLEKRDPGSYYNPF